MSAIEELDLHALCMKLAAQHSGQIDQERIVGIFEPTIKTFIEAERDRLLEPMANAIGAMDALLKAHSETEMTYEGAYHFVFKSSGRKVWIGLAEAADKLESAIREARSKSDG